MISKFFTTGLTISFLFLLCSKVTAQVIFQENFDSQADWTRSQPSGGSETDLTPSATVPTNWTDFRNEFSIFSLSPSLGTSGHPTMNIISGSEYAYGGTGKAFVYYSESGEDTYCGPTVWCSDGLLGKSLVGTNYSQGYDDIYIRFKLKLQPGWQWRMGGAMKILHVSHYGGNGNLYDYHSSNENKPRMVAVLQLEPDWRTLRLMTLNSCLPTTGTIETYYNPHNQSYAGEGDPAVTPGCAWGGANCMAGGEWHTLEFRLKMNSAAGRSDGIMQFWVDGIMEGSKTDINWISQDASGNPADPANYRWNHVWLGGNNYNGYAARSSVSEQWYAIDDVVIANEYIGPQDAPIAPRNLRIH
jgi:chitinase